MGEVVIASLRTLISFVILTGAHFVEAVPLSDRGRTDTSEFARECQRQLENEAHNSAPDEWVLDHAGNYRLAKEVLEEAGTVLGAFKAIAAVKGFIHQSDPRWIYQMNLYGQAGICASTCLANANTAIRYAFNHRLQGSFEQHLREFILQSFGIADEKYDVDARFGLHIKQAHSILADLINKAGLSDVVDLDYRSIHNGDITVNPAHLVGNLNSFAITSVCTANRESCHAIIILKIDHANKSFIVSNPWWPNRLQEISYNETQVNGVHTVTLSLDGSRQLHYIRSALIVSVRPEL